MREIAITCLEQRRSWRNGGTMQAEPNPWVESWKLNCVLTIVFFTFDSRDEAW